jgi:Flp pilus assembly protein TadG
MTVRAGLAAQDGSASTQLVLATPALLTLLMLIVQTGLWFHACHLAHAAAQEGARAARIEAGTAAAGRARAEAFLDALAAGVLFDRRVTASRTLDSAHIQVTGHVVGVIPGLHWPVKATARGPVERFHADIPGR